jgi:hypothetical protein
MTMPATEPGHEEEKELPPWSDPSPYSQMGGSDFWLGCGDVGEDGALRGWWIRRLSTEVKTHTPDAGAEVWDRMIMWLAEAGDVSEYLFFVTSERYEPGSPPGYWELNKELLKKDLPEAFRWAVTAVGANEMPDLDTFLKDPSRGLGVAPREPEGRGLLSDPKIRAGWFAATRRRREHWPRPCRTCGEDFRPERRRAVRCAACREKDQELRQKRASNPETCADKRRRTARP